MDKPYKPRRNRKISDEQVRHLNNLGMSLRTMAAILDVHPTAVTSRLKLLKLNPMDTRHSFMETVYRELSEDEANWVAEQVGTEQTVRDFLVTILRNAYEKANAA